VGGPPVTVAVSVVCLPLQIETFGPRLTLHCENRWFPNPDKINKDKSKQSFLI
jgi:hypothetical protein